MAEKKTIWQLLRNRYPAGECVLMQEVSDTTGGRNRSADYIVVNMWPSRGNSIIGFEQKTYRSDWLNELKNPAKQEAIFKFCDYFYLLTDKDDVAKLEEIPVNWGWVHYDGKRLKTMKEAPRLTPVPCTRQFMCAMLRRADSKEGYIHRDDVQDKIDELVEMGIKRRINENEYKLKQYDELQKKVEDFKTASGVDIGEGWSWRGGKEMGEAVKIIMKWENLDNLKAVEGLQNQVERILKSIKENVADFKKVDNLLKADA